MRETVRQLRAVIDECVAAPVWSLGDGELLACLDGVHAAEQALAAVKLHLVHQAETRDLPAADHARSCAMWLRQRLRISVQAAKRLVDLARDVDRRPALDEALGDGTLNVEQAQVIAATVTDLPAQVGAEALDKAEGMLIGFATEFEPVGLRKLGTRILAHVAPEVAEKAGAAALARQEARAHTTRGFTLTATTDGRVRVSGWLDREAAAVINAALDPLCTPGRPHQPTRHGADGQGVSSEWDRGSDWSGPSQDGSISGDGTLSGDEALSGGGTNGDGTNGRGSRVGGTRVGGPDGGGSDSRGFGGGADERWVTRDERTPAQRRADALVEVCRLTLGTAQLPDNGGDRPQVVVTVPFDVLRQQLGTATLDTGQPLSATQVRRLACDAQVLPAVLGGEGQVLDVGTSRRLFTGPLRRALVLRDGGCAFPACDRPSRWTEGHHIRHWSQGGPTTLDNGALLCGPHHRVIHQGDWTVRLGADRRPEFVPPAYLDPERKPRRNIYHRIPNLIGRT